MPLALQPANVIHAHSHVAFFGWASPALFAGIYCVLPRLTGRPLTGVPVIRWQLGLTHVATIGALITFSAGGYTPASIVFSSLNGIIWYAFVWVYWKNVAGLPWPLPVALRYLHVATALLVLSSTGTWLVAALTGSGVTDPLLQAMGLHLFLNNFIDGWLLIGLFGLVTFILSNPSASSPSTSGPTVERDDQWAAGPLVWLTVLTPLAFFADLIPSGLSPFWAAVGVFARTALAVPYGVFLWRALRRYFEHSAFESAAAAFLLIATLFLVGKMIAHGGSVVAALVPSRQLFIAYLHLNLLGFFSSGIIGSLYVFAGWNGMQQGTRTSLGVVGAYVLAVGVAGMVLALFAAAAADVGLQSAARSMALERLFQAAFVFAVVALAGMGVTGVHLPRQWRSG